MVDVSDQLQLPEGHFTELMYHKRGRDSSYSITKNAGNNEDFVRCHFSIVLLLLELACNNHTLFVGK